MTLPVHPKTTLTGTPTTAPRVINPNDDSGSFLFLAVLAAAVTGN